LFAVYDGHGGAEVAEYCSAKLPDFLCELESFKSGNYEQALKDAFMGFDATLLEDNVVEKLRQIARKNPDYEESESDDETAEEIINLHQEATMPLSEVLEKYKGNVDKISKMQKIIQFHSKEAETGGPSSSSSCAPSGSGSSENVSNQSGSGCRKTASENEVSSSSCKPIEKESESTNEPSSSSSLSNTIQSNDQAPDSTYIPTLDTKSVQCTSESSDVDQSTASLHGINKEKASEKSSDDAISSSSVQENGEVVNNCSSSTSAMAAASSNSSPSKPSVAKNTASYIPNHISSSDNAHVAETESDDIESTDDEHDETYKESPSKKPLNSDDDTTDEEDLDEEELSNEGKNN
jgi:protein phosphatase 1G